MSVTAKLLQSCPTLCNPIDSSPPGSPILGILQARTLEWVAISSLVKCKNRLLISLFLSNFIFKMWSTGEGNGKPLQYSCLENPVNSMKRQNNRILKEELPRSVGAQYATGDEWRNNSRKNEGMEPKQKQYPAVDVTGDRS